MMRSDIVQTYKIIRHYKNSEEKETIKIGLTYTEAKEHCDDKETSSGTCTLPENVQRTQERGPWFDGYYRE
jgi:midasin (ATPase involved in ribosome maturation)